MVPGWKNTLLAKPNTTLAGTMTSGSSGLPGTARITPAKHFLAPGALPQMALATEVRTFLRRSTDTPVSSATYIPPAIRNTSCALLRAPIGSAAILLALPVILTTLLLSTLVLLGRPRVASTPRSLAEKEVFKSLPKLSSKASLTDFLAPGPAARITVLVVCSFWPIFPRPSFAMAYAATS
eukprot:5215348-Heterocapsa_arctica.AAC.1